MAARCDATPAGEAQRAALRRAIDFKTYEFDCHGVEMNQRYASAAVLADPAAGPEGDLVLHYRATTRPGARLPHAWVYDAQGGKHSTLDLCGRGRFTLLTGIGGAPWIAAAEAAGRALGMPVRTVTIGPRADFEDHVGDWDKVREIGDAGALLVRPDHHVAWRAAGMAADPAGDLSRALRAVLGR
jgi:2,4-dichlorophenol 6-monooxygenase